MKNCDHAHTRGGDDSGYTASVAAYPYTYENRAAQGGITVEVRCLDCGAVRQENHNGGYVEVGPWRPGNEEEDR